MKPAASALYGRTRKGKVFSCRRAPKGRRNSIVRLMGELKAARKTSGSFFEKRFDCVWVGDEKRRKKSGITLYLLAEEQGEAVCA